MAPPNPDRALLQTFVPAHVQHLLASRDHLGPTPFHTTKRGAAFVADIVGFTALAEAFEKAYEQGADELSALLADLVGFLSEIIERHAGEVVHIAGDGVLAVWLVDGDADLRAATQCCIGAALEIQEAAAARIADGGHPIRMRVGVGAGPMWLPVVGDEHGRQFALVGGEPLDQIARALGAARPGDVVVARDAAGLASESLTGAATPHGLIRATSITGASLPRRAEPAVRDESLLASIVPETVAARAAAGMTSRFAEIRQATSVFVKVRGLGTSGELVIDDLQQLTTAFQTEVRRYDGTVPVMLLDESGLSMIGTWGGTGHAHEDDAVRALRAAMAFAAQADGRDLGVGVASGRIYFGDVGTDRLRRFTVLGHPVNLAARLAISESDTPVRCDGATMTAARRGIAFEERDLLHLKGVPEPTRTFRPVAAIESARGEPSPMVGRSHEQAVLAHRFGEFLDGTGGIVFIEGEPGIGKSTLLRDLLRTSQAHPARRLTVRGSPIDQSTPYHPWRAVFDTLLESVDVTAALDQILAPDERRFVGLLSPVISRLPTVTDPPPEVSPSDRIETTRRILARLFASLVTGAPLLLVLEDAHWYDTSTWALAEAVITLRPDALVVCATRGIGSPPDPAEVRLRRDTTVLRLRSLTPDETVALACDRLDVPSVPDHLAALIQNRTEGHPLFTEELLRSLRDAGVIGIRGTSREVTVDRQALEALEVPSTVAAIIATRIDRLPLTHQDTLKVASVVGRSFTAADIEAIHPEGLSAETIQAHLDAASAIELVTSGDAEVAEGLRFSHVLTREAIYGLLTGDDKAALHLALARSLVARGDTPPSVLAHHWSAGGDPAAAAVAYDEAARQAFESGAPREAIELLTRGGALAVPDPSPLETARREALWGEAHIQLGELERGHRHLVTAVERAGMRMPPNRWRLAVGLLGQLVRQLAHRVLTRRARPADVERIEIGSAAYWSMTATTFGRQDAPGLTYVGLRATNNAERIPSSPTLAQGYSFIAYAAGVIGLARRSVRYHERALAAAAAANSPAATAEVKLNRAVMLVGMGQWDAASSELAAAADGFHRLGRRTDRARTLSVQAYVHFHRGEFDEADALWHETSTVGSDSDLIRAWVTTGHARAAARLGRRAETISILGANRQLIEDVAELPSTITRFGFNALALWQEGRLDAAVESAKAGLSAVEGTEAFAAPHTADGISEVARVLLAAHDVSQDASSRALAERAVRSLERVARRLPMARPRALTSRAALLAGDGKRSAAARRLRRALEQAEALAMPYERALVLREMGRILADPEARARSDDELAAIGAREDDGIIGLDPPAA